MLLYFILPDSEFTSLTDTRHITCLPALVLVDDSSQREVMDADSVNGEEVDRLVSVHVEMYTARPYRPP
jgi:hypothetical protein